MNISKGNSLKSLGQAKTLSELSMLFETEKKRKRSLAEKVMIVKGLTQEEKQEICSLLIDDDLPMRKKGRPSESIRDMGFAFDYLEAKYNKWTGIDCIAKKHKIPNHEQTTIYKALARGLKALEEDSREAERSAEKMLTDIDENSSLVPRLKWLFHDAQYKLLLIEYHRSVKELERVTGKKKNH